MPIAVPRPGAAYLSSDVECHSCEILHDGFLIVACDGVWDEMSSEEVRFTIATSPEHFFVVFADGAGYHSPPPFLRRLC